MTASLADFIQANTELASKNMDLVREVAAQRDTANAMLEAHEKTIAALRAALAAITHFSGHNPGQCAARNSEDACHCGFAEAMRLVRAAVNQFSSPTK